MRRSLGVAALAAALFACLGSSTPATPPAAPEPPAVSDEEALQFAQRAERFYSALSDVPLDALVTYDNKNLHSYFPSPGAFADYYSALATEARVSTLRDGEAVSVKIHEFHFEGPEQAVVDFEVRGEHERRLLFWDVKFDRRDVWRRVDGVWLVFPAKL
jgi:hypothetical protein